MHLASSGFLMEEAIDSFVEALKVKFNWFLQIVFLFSDDEILISSSKPKQSEAHKSNAGNFSREILTNVAAKELERSRG